MTSVATWNILSQSKANLDCCPGADSGLLNPRNRQTAVLSTIRSLLHVCDVVCLYEVPDEILKILWSEAWSVVCHNVPGTREHVVLVSSQRDIGQTAHRPVEDLAFVSTHIDGIEVGALQITDVSDVPMAEDQVRTAVTSLTSGRASLPPVVLVVELPAIWPEALTYPLAECGLQPVLSGVATSVSLGVTIESSLITTRGTRAHAQPVLELPKPGQVYVLPSSTMPSCHVPLVARFEIAI